MKKESKFFKKIFYSYLIIFTILTLIVEVLVCSSIVSNNQKKTIKLETFFEENYTAMENKILSIFQVTNLLSESEEVRLFAEIPYDAYRGTDYYSLFRLSDKISNYTVSYLDGDCKIGLFRPEDNLFFDGQSTKRLDEHLSGRKIDIETMNRSLEEGKESPINALIMLGGGDDTSFVTLMCWHEYPSGSYIYYLIDFDKNYFLPASGANPGEFFAVVDKKSNNICVNQRSQEIKENKILPQVKETELLSQTDMKFENGLFSKQSHLIQNLLYTYYNPGVYSFSSYILISLLLLLLWMLLMIVGIYISRNLAKKLYGPVNNVFGILGDVYHQDYDDDMLFLSDSVADLVSNNKRLQELAEKNKVFLKHSFIKDLLTGNVAKTQIQANLKEYNMEYLMNRCLCVVGEYVNTEIEDDVMDYQKIQTLKGIFMGTAEEHLRVSVSCELVNIDRSRFAIITSEVASFALNKVLLGLVNEAEEQYNISLIMAVGKTVSGIADIDDSYMSALNLLEYRLVLGDKLIIRVEDLAELGSTSYYYPVEVEKNLIYNVLEGNTDKCDDILTNIFTVNFSELSLDKYNIKDFKFAITATIKRILKQINQTAEDIFGKDVIIYLELNAASDIGEIEKSVRDIVGEITRYIQENSKNKKRVITQSIVKYIDENYHRDISLGDVAEHFCLSEGHIGRLLKNDLNTSFKQYLNERRIEVAKGLLLSEENLSVGDVATMVGCNSAMTFIRMFKKHTGISPGEYKKTQL